MAEIFLKNDHIRQVDGRVRKGGQSRLIDFIDFLPELPALTQICSTGLRWMSFTAAESIWLGDQCRSTVTIFFPALSVFAQVWSTRVGYRQILQYDGIRLAPSKSDLFHQMFCWVINHRVQGVVFSEFLKRRSKPNFWQTPQRLFNKIHPNSSISGMSYSGWMDSAWIFPRKSARVHRRLWNFRFPLISLFFREFSKNNLF